VWKNILKQAVMNVFLPKGRDIIACGELLEEG
jgi:hypothetical protein